MVLLVQLAEVQVEVADAADQRAPGTFTRPKLSEPVQSERGISLAFRLASSAASRSSEASGGFAGLGLVALPLRLLVEVSSTCSR